MRTELIKLVKRVSEILPQIEAARPRCLSGMEALCSLSSAIDKAKSLLQKCSVSSKLYLALTGDAILSRFEEARSSLERILSQIQTMVPLLLAAEISIIVAELRGTTFSLDPSEEEAGNVVCKLINQYGSAPDSVEEIELQTIRTAALWLHITSKSAVSMEKRSIKKLLDKLREGEHAKRKILSFFWYLLNKYGKLIIDEHNGNCAIQHQNQGQTQVQSYGDAN